MDKNPCDDYDEDTVRGLWGDNDCLSLCDILDLEIPAEDRIWAVTQFLCDRSNRLFAADCAESVLHLFEAERPNDNLPRLAIQAARDYANGTKDAAARDAARDAASAASAAASAAAWENQLGIIRVYCEEADND